MDDESGSDNETGEETYQLGPDGTPVGTGGDADSPEPETAVEHREAARRALRKDDTEAAFEYLERAVALSREAGDEALLAGALTDRGNVRMERADTDEGDPRAEPDTGATRRAVEAAVEDYTAAIDADPEHGEAHFNRGLARARLGERADSTADLERAADLDAGHPFLVRGNLCAEAGADEYAREDFGRCIDRTDTARAYFNRGNANRRLGDVDAAVADFEAALDRAAELPDDGLRVLVRIGEVTDGETAATHRIRAGFLAIAGRDVWRGVDLAAAALEDAPEGSEAWTDAAAVLAAGDAIRGAAGYGPDEEIDVDVDGLHAGLAEADLPAATAALVAAATDGDDADGDGIGDLEAPTDLAAAVADRDHGGLRRAAVAALERQLRIYR